MISDHSDAHPNIRNSRNSREEGSYQELDNFEKKASESVEYMSFMNADTEFHNVAFDCWGAMVFVIVSDLPHLVGGKLTLEQGVRMVFGTIFFSVNLLIQGVLLFFIVTMLMMPSFEEAQNLYKEFHNTTFEHGNFSQQLFDNKPDDFRSHLCGLALISRFIGIILFLWVCTNVGEFLNVVRYMQIVTSLASLPEGLDPRVMVHDVEHTRDLEAQIICLSPIVRFALMAIIYVPKMIIAVVLMVTGSLWLLATESLSDLILNSLALGFVTHVDELLAAVFFPSCFKEQLVSLGYAAQKDPDSKDPTKEGEMRTISYIGGGLTLLVSFILVQAMVTFQPVLPHFANDVQGACAKYIQSQFPECHPFESDCFPIAN